MTVALDNFRAPYVFADRNSQAYAAEIYGPRHRTRREHTFFVKHTVIRKVDFVAQSRDFTLLEQRDGDVVTLVLNDPDHRNAMTEQMGELFADRIGRLVADDSLRAVILTGAGRAFSAGGDMTMLEARAAEGRARPGIARPSIASAGLSSSRLPSSRPRRAGTGRLRRERTPP